MRRSCRLSLCPVWVWLWGRAQSIAGSALHCFVQPPEKKQKHGFDGETILVSTTDHILASVSRIAQVLLFDGLTTAGRSRSNKFLLATVEPAEEYEQACAVWKKSML